ncbi:DHS-like NAD/FAD-binding domain-containing protein [Pseudomassariella vexata]|uniref:DHS-like NAD/FAD-binding domain-containing protein n=1 Tax=Pseudomassariella vexata TaxID=1141098 RepID=A0A1Y2DGI1_9PEZI|nr:DHS-like NAD/FAD-binding domain-containing protein [Pseudomassariella vexata]ORY58226.1 DHS-like NAD/FAD-binding domain-containing protein [Pseudomassariella vexata]
MAIAPSSKTIHVTPDSNSHLHQIANTMANAKNIIFVTGAGISTGAGIPTKDFRSKNGLYTAVSSNARDLFHVTAFSHPQDGPALVALCTQIRQKVSKVAPTKTHQLVSYISYDKN